MRHLIVLFFLTAGFAKLKAQKADIIYQVNGREIRTYMLQVKEREATYRIRNTKNATTYKMPTDSIVKVRYASGRVYYYQIQRLSGRPVNIPKPQFQPPTIPSQLQKKPKGQKPDLILTKDRRIIECEIIEITDREIEYTAFTDDTQKIRTLRRKDILGHEKNLPEKPQPPVIVQKVEQKKIEDTVKVNSIASSYRLYFSGVYIAPQFSPQWATDQIGLGLRNGIGAFFAYQYRFSKQIGLAFNGGYHQWEVERQFTRSQQTVYQTNERLTRTSFTFDLRAYLKRNFYISSNCNTQLISLLSTSSKDYLLPSYNRHQYSFYLGYGAKTGIELVSKKSVFDIGVGINILPKKTNGLVTFYTLTNRLIFFETFVGIGFSKQKR